MSPRFRILVVNPGSTSTKMAVFEDDRELARATLSHNADELSTFRTVWEQFDFRVREVRAWAHPEVERADAVVAIGGLLRPLPGGTYRVNRRMLDDARGGLQGEHASNLGCALADALAGEYGCPALVVDPVSVDEFEPLARYSGHPLIERRSLSHALNIHAAARRAAEELGLDPERATLVVAHLGGGISVSPLRGGRIIDANDASSDGPFSPERTGGLPLQQFLTLCFSGSFTENDLRTFVRGRGGLTAYLGTNSALEVERRIAKGDGLAREVFEAMAYQIAKEIGAMATVLAGDVRAIVLTGGCASSALLTGWITDRVRSIAPVLVYPGEDEMRSLALGALRALTGSETALEY